MSRIKMVAITAVTVAELLSIINVDVLDIQYCNVYHTILFVN